uniref:Latent-transforming growth factor beta-binding protein 2 n=1 Tax=Poecilia formosa TaxID=48698 RepID=A0A096LZI3_POEFO
MSRGASASRGETVHAAGASGEDFVSSSHDRAQRTARHPRTSRVNRRQSSKPGSSSTRRLAGPNVCGGQQCCSGWAVAPGTNRCIKPDCQPPCQNRGSCSRPHTCVCRSGFQGPRCEEVAPEQVYIRERGTLRRIQPGTKPFQRDPPQRRPSERKAADTTKLQTPRPVTTKQPAQTADKKWPLRQQSGTSRTVKRYPSSSEPITSNALPNGNGFANGHGRHIHTSTTPSPKGANLTSNLDRIKIVFTPMLCRRVCSGGRCYNSCEKGDVTTVYSDKNQGFRLFFCQIPCMNGGRCIGRDLCWCPSNSTGKFCHLPAPPPPRPTPHSRKDASHQAAKSPSHSTYTLPLSNQHVSLHPSLVNVHIQHPPEAEVQVHQVARVQPGQRPATTDGAHSVQQRSQPGNGHEYTSEHNGRLAHGNGHWNGHGTTSILQNGHVGRCFQETVDGQCGKPLPGLTKQDDCCGSVGASWGLNKCQKCPTKPAYAVIANGQVECPKGFKRMNITHCQADINECLLPGICKNAECLNTKGSYRCTCKPGYMLDAARSHCVSDKAVSDHRASCYRSVSSGTCSLPLVNHITKQICCCSRVGKAWGNGCDRCPLPGSDHFKEICPAGHGYTYSRSDVQISLRQLEDDELQSTGVTLEEQEPEFPSSQPSRHNNYPQILQYPETPRVPQYTLTSQYPSESGQETAKLQDDLEILMPPPVVTESPPNYPVESSPDSPDFNMRPDLKETSPGVSVTAYPKGINKCATSPNICGHGKCVPVQNGYTCDCDPGFKLSVLQNSCIDVNECEMDPCEGKGHCINSYGSYTCQCHSGYSQVITQNRKFCQDINECSMPNKCQNGQCVNTEGSFTCECNDGYSKSWRGLCEADVDECRDHSSCPNGICVNTLGSFQCQTCGPGFRPIGGRCVDVDECMLPGICLHGRCVNLDGTHKCTCNLGYRVSSDSKSCEDIDECAVATTCPQGKCTNTEGSFTCVTCQPGFTVSDDGQNCEDIDECRAAGVCLAGVCVNTEGSFSCMSCHPGFSVAPNGLSCEDVNECEDASLCLGGQCTNTIGSYSCLCPSGLELGDGTSCRNINECLTIVGICGEGSCLNTEGSYRCMCPDGFTTTDEQGALAARDVDECSRDDVCIRGECLNTEGSFLCLCEAGFKYNTDSADCEADQDECKEFGSSVCGTWSCKNTIGSYQCFMECQPDMLSGDCADIDECNNETICGSHGFCENTAGSFRCHCDQGYTNPPGDITRCVDLNECEMSSALCGEALCENVDGSFLCICPNDNEEFDPETNQCRSMVCVTGFSAVPDSKPASTSTHITEERKDCYYNLNDVNLCNNVLSHNTTKQECCCTAGGGWGDNCEIHPCPPVGRDDYNQLCPHGNGLLTLPGSSLLGHGEDLRYKDANECEMFGSEICKNGQCSNFFSGYTCYCQSGYFYDKIRLECVDYDECGFGNPCENGACVNTAGSFNCFCSPPLVLDGTQRRCVSFNTTEVDSDQDVHVDICWRRLEGDNMCAEPIEERRTTYTECCCLYGVAWSGQCAFCPRKDSVDYASMCNLPRTEGADSLRERIGYEYGVEEPELPPYWDNYGGGIPESVPIFTDGDYSNPQPPFRVPVLRPGGSQPQPLDRYTGRTYLTSSRSERRYDSFEGLRAEECGILNGCENGRCVRVREGYTCDCFDGYELNLDKMACIDINECEDISDKVPLCQNGQCINTEGSYQCTCLPGFVASAKPHKCISAI